MGRRILLFAYYFPPLGGAGSQRALSFARHLPDHGWDVVVVAPKEGVYGVDPTLDAEDLHGVTVLRTGTWEPSVLLKSLRGSGAAESGGPGAFADEAALGVVGSAVRSVVRRAMYFPDSARGWIGEAVKAARRAHRESPFDVVLSSSPPVSAHLAASRFSGEEGVPLVLDVRDLWRRAVESREGKEGRLQAELLAGAAGVTTVGEVYAKWLSSAGMKGTPEVIYNGWEPRPGGDGPGDAGPPSLVHAGTTYPGLQDFAFVARVVERFRSEGRPMTLRLIGSVDPETRRELAPHVGRGAVTIEPFRASEEVGRILAASTAILVASWSGGGPICEGHIPAKLFDAIPARRPVLLVSDEGSEAAALAGSLGIDRIPPGDEGALHGAVAAILRGGSRPPRPADDSRFTRGRQAARLAAFLDRVVGNGA